MTVEVFAKRPEVAVPCGCILGEGVIWDHRTGTLHWVDIVGETLWSWRPGSGEEAAGRHVGERVGFALLTDDSDTLVLGLKSGLARLSLAGGPPTILVRPEPDMPGNRLNDGAAAPDGSIFFGSLNDADQQPSGHFYHWSPAGLTRFGQATKTTNGPALDPERRLIYATDTSRGRVMRHPILDDGLPGPAEDFVTFGEGEGHPDGMTVDAEGHVWICHFRGARITRFDPEGEPALVVPMPTAQPTKLTFGGPDLSTIYISTAARDLDREVDPLAGHVFRIDAGIRGRPAELCSISRP